MQRTFTVGAVTIVPPRDDIEATYKIIEESVKAHPEADMLCFGELFLTQDKDDLIDPNKSARYETIVAQINALSATYDTAVSYGTILNEDDKFYICQKVALPDGQTYSYTKIHLGKNEQKTYDAGDKIDTFRYKGFTFGVQICLDTHIAEMSIIQKSKGAEIILAPFNTPYDVGKRLANWAKYIPARAYEYNLCFVCCNLHGGAMIINGYGEVVKESASKDTVELYTISSEKDFNNKINYFAYRKPEVYRNNE